ncbi:MAG: type VII secretion protein EssB/YukC [Oscillospiraceae bacterium]
MQTLERVLKNNETELPKGKRPYLTYENEYLAPCTLIQADDDFTLNFHVDGMKPFAEIGEKSKIEKFRALANCAELETLRAEYYFSIEPENMVYDINLRPEVIMRDAPKNDDNFLGEYKALIGEVLYPRYKFADYYLGGKDLFKKKSILKQVKQQPTVSDLKGLLLTEYDKELEILKRHKLLVNKKSAIVSRIMIPVLSGALCALCIKGYFIMFVDMPYKDSLIKANTAYVADDYIGTQQALASLQTDSLPLSDKYILARSYIITESLTADQKKNVLSGITLKTDERVLHYWIELGRLNSVAAIDYAKRLGDDELLLFALIKESASIKNNTAIEGEKKATRTKELETQIKSLTEQMDKESVDVSNNLLNEKSENKNGEDTSE